MICMNRTVVRDTSDHADAEQFKMVGFEEAVTLLEEAEAQGHVMHAGSLSVGVVRKEGERLTVVVNYVDSECSILLSSAEP